MTDHYDIGRIYLKQISYSFINIVTKISYFDNGCDFRLSELSPS